MQASLSAVLNTVMISVRSTYSGGQIACHHMWSLLDGTSPSFSEDV